MKNIFNTSKSALKAATTASLIFTFGACTSNNVEENNYPNVIYVFPDQFRNSAMEFWANDEYSSYLNHKSDPVITPNLNKFASQSIVFSSAFSSTPVSSAHRGSLMTGMYPNNSGVSLNCNSNRPISSLRDDVETVGDVFSSNGYDCAYIGKYHLDYPTPNDPENPGHYVEKRIPAWDAYTPKEKRHGFNFWYSYGTFDTHKTPHYWDSNGKRHEIREWSPKHEVDVAINYLENLSDDRDSSKPFFLMISMNPPHHPYKSLNDCMEEDYNLYKDKSLGELLVRDNVDTTMVKAKSAAYYFAQITGVDREFGRLLSKLEELNLSDNTIVVFASDHGDTMCSHGIDDAKNSPYTEATNIPFIVRYPNKIKHSVTNKLITSQDIMPTLLSLSGLENKVPKTVQGESFANYILTGDDENIPNSALYIRNLDGEKDDNGKTLSYFPETRGVKTQEFTMTITIDRSSKLKNILLFDDINDPYQMNNLDINDYPEVAEKLMYELAALLKKSDDPWYNEKVLSDLITYQ
ncbi:MAG: sulfatase [Proteiniphilum sp.]|nr:sulfatase [Proteiniphilum sp.]